MNNIIRISSTLLLTTALWSATPLLAATPGGPAIAYTSLSGNTPTVYLSDGVGSSATKLYVAPSRSNIDEVDMRPGGHELAISEHSGARREIKIITYNDAGASTGVTTLTMTGCVPTGFDYHPSGDGSLIIARYCGSAQNLEVVRYANGSFEQLVTLGTGADNAMGPVRWLSDGSGFLLAYMNLTSGALIRRHMMSNPSAPVTVWSSPNNSALPGYFDVAHCVGCSKFIYTDQSSNLHEVIFGDSGGTDQGVLMAGFDGHYSPTGQILYRVSNKTSQQLKIDSQTLVAKGTFGGKDWRQ